MKNYLENLLSWVESRICGINQRVTGSSPVWGANQNEPLTKKLVSGFLLLAIFTPDFVEKSGTNEAESSRPWLTFTLQGRLSDSTVAGIALRTPKSWYYGNG